MTFLNLILQALDRIQKSYDILFISEILNFQIKVKSFEFLFKQFLLIVYIFAYKNLIATQKFNSTFVNLKIDAHNSPLFAQLFR